MNSKMKKKKKFENIPNIITLSRLFTIPLLLVLFPINVYFFKPLSALIFLASAIADILDGTIARKYQVTSKIGALMDPIVDKMIDATALFLLVEGGILYTWMAVVIVCRDIAVSGIRLIALEYGFSVDVNTSGKIKTAATEAGIILLLVGRDLFGFPCHAIGMSFIWIALFFTVYSGYLYWVSFWNKFSMRIVS